MSQLNSSKRFIPFRKKDIIDLCLNDGTLSAESQAQFRHFSQRLQALFHCEFHQRSERLKDSFSPLNPDRDTRTLASHPADEQCRARFVGELEHLLDKANFEQVSETDLAHALEQDSLFKIKLHVDFDEFSEVLLYCRGESERKESLPVLFGLRQRQVTFLNYDRVVIYIRFKEDLDEKQAAARDIKPGSVMLKLFKNVPKADLEMLFPNTAVRMRWVDKLMIGVPALVSGGVVISTKLGATLVLLGSFFGFWLGLHSTPVVFDKPALLALMAGSAAVGGYLWKQFNNFKNRKLRFVQSLTQNLYFKNLDNNAGVFHRLIDAAEEEECKEAILAYYFLLKSPVPLTAQALDQQIEHWFSSQHHCSLDFEIEDALMKLTRLNLISSTDQQHFSALELPHALSCLERHWQAQMHPDFPESLKTP
ncbi:MAG: TMEM143 family protein [Pontibacterium sp.]